MHKHWKLYTNCSGRLTFLPICILRMVTNILVGWKCMAMANSIDWKRVHFSTGNKIAIFERIKVIRRCFQYHSSNKLSFSIDFWPLNRLSIECSTFSMTKSFEQLKFTYTNITTKENRTIASSKYSLIMQYLGANFKNVIEISFYTQ